MSPTPPRGFSWSRAGTSEFLFRELGKEWTVFHLPSGETHLLNPIAVQVYRSLGIEPAPESAVVASALTQLGFDDDAELDILARQTLHYLCGIGLARFG